MYKIIGADGKEYGPVSAEQLRQWYAEGRVNGLTRVQAEGTTEWKPISQVAEFAGVFGSVFAGAFPPTPPTPPPSAAPGISMAMPSSGQPVNSQMAIWSMVMGILSIVCCPFWFIFGPIGIILGALALAKIKKEPNFKGSGFAVTGIVLGGIALLVGVSGTILMFTNPNLRQQLQDFQNQLQQQQR